MDEPQSWHSYIASAAKASTAAGDETSVPALADLRDEIERLKRQVALLLLLNEIEDTSEEWDVT